MANAAALDRLMSLGGELYTRPGEPRRKFDLNHMRLLLAALDHPEKRFASILIAGTNGKGSTAATLASILTASGYKVGLYTSPHLVRLNERIRIGGFELEDELLFQYFAHVEQASAELVRSGVLPNAPSFFESVTAIAMLAFASQTASGLPVDIAVLEVGMGGRLDATNVVEPLFAIITDIALDHTEWLGDTIAEIAVEKAGILRQSGTMITLPQHPEANQALGEAAVSLQVQGINAAEYLPGREASIQVENRYELSRIPGMEGSLTVDSPLRGHHQQRNLALAIAAAVELRDRHGFQISREQIERGIRETVWMGRLEFFPPTPARPAVLLDVAHNPAGAWSLRAALSQMHVEGQRVLIFGCMRDKAVGEMAQILFPVFDRVYLVELPSARAASGLELLAAAAPTGSICTLSPDPESAFTAALEETAGSQGALITICGSVVLVGALRPRLV